MDYIVKVYKDWRLQSQFHEIVSDMEDECFFAEKQSIRDSGRSLKKYGSTCNHVRNNEQLVRHELAKTDTLQGIALKYGCTTEQIRRTNRLFAQDSLFLRQHLMIPVAKDSPHYPDDESRAAAAAAASPSSSASATSLGALPDFSSCASNDSNQTQQQQQQAGAGPATDATPVVLSPEEESRKDIDAFLGKIDSTLAQTRKYVAKSQNSFDFDASLTPSSDEPFSSRRFHMSTSSSASSSSYQQHQQQQNSSHSHHHQHHQHQHHQRHSSSASGSGSSSNTNNNNHHDSIELITLTTQSRRVQNSLQQLEKQQDDFFKL